MDRQAGIAGLPPSGGGQFIKGEDDMVNRRQWLAGCAVGAVGASAPAPAAEVPRQASALKTFSGIGKELRPFRTGKSLEAELFRHAGRGCLTHMWFGGDFRAWDRTRLRVYVDREQQASIDMELFLGHGIGFGDAHAPWGVARIGKTGHPSGVYNTYRIPFGNGVRVTAQLAPDAEPNPPFWWIVRGTENLPAEVGGIRLPDAARLKLHKRDAYVAKRLEEFDLCNVPGAGALHQVTIAARANRPAGSPKDFSYLEACMRAYLDGSKEPMFLSSGLEDYFLGTYYFNRGRYWTPVAGLTHIDPKDGSFSAYRFHEDDPVFFENGLRLTCRCGEELRGQVFHDPAETTYTTYAWVYQWPRNGA
jgi:hypothetical protein